MPIPITIPRLGWNMEEGVFVGWLKRDGDEIKAGDSLFSLESEKATEDVECLDSGILRVGANSPKAGDSVRVGDVIGHFPKPRTKLGEFVARMKLLQPVPAGIRGARRLPQTFRDQFVLGQEVTV